MDTTFEVSDILAGDPEVVSTSYGPLTVTIFGDRKKSPCIAYHEVGLNHHTCFHSLVVASGPASLLLKNFYVLFIDAPGCQVIYYLNHSLLCILVASHPVFTPASPSFSLQAPDATLPPEAQGLTLEKMADQVYEVAQHYNLRECLGLGVGNGGYILAECAACHPKLFAGLVLISPSCRPAGWWEWAMGRVAAMHLRTWGWTSTARNHFARRLFSPATLQILGGDSDLIRAFRRDIQTIPPAAAEAYFTAVLNRPSLVPAVKILKCRVLMVYGAEGLYEGDCMELSAAIDKSRFALMEVQYSGVLVNEERPTELLSPVQLFLTALQLEGIGLGSTYEVGV